MSMTEDRWPTEWLRGVLEVCTLAVLVNGPAHGYSVAQQLEGAGLGQIKGGTLYPLLARLENAGLVTSAWVAGGAGPGRKVYEITEHGRAERKRRALLWHRFTELTRSITEAASPTPRPTMRTSA